MVRPRLGPGGAAAVLAAAFLAGAASAHAAPARIAYVTEDDEISTNIASILPNGKGDKLITQTGFYDTDPAWGPRHRGLAFIREDRLFIVSASGKNTRRVPHTKKAESPQWSRNGKKIVFSMRRHKAVAVFRIRKNGTGLKRLTRFIPDPHHNIFGLNPQYTPNGKSITYDTPKGIVKMGAGGGHKRLIIKNAENLDWSPNGKRVAFVRKATIFIARPNGSHARSLTGKVSDDDDDDPAWSPTGDRIVYSQTVGGLEEDESGGAFVIKPDGTGNHYVAGGDYSEPDW